MHSVALGWVSRAQRRCKSGLASLREIEIRGNTHVTVAVAVTVTITAAVAAIISAVAGNGRRGEKDECDDGGEESEFELHGMG